MLNRTAAPGYQVGALSNFRRGGSWDPQRIDGSFHPEFVDYSTVAIGLYAAANGILRNKNAHLRTSTCLGSIPGGMWSNALPGVVRAERAAGHSKLACLIEVLRRQAEGVEVDVHFDPDDPAARAVWLKQTDQLPDQ